MLILYIISTSRWIRLLVLHPRALYYINVDEFTTYEKMKPLFYQKLLSCMLVIFSILSFSACDTHNIDIENTTEVVGTWSDSQVQSATGSTRYMSVVINEDGSGELYFESLAYVRIAGFTWTFRNNILTCSGTMVETTSDGEVNIDDSWGCTFEYMGSALRPQRSPYKDFVLTQSGRPSDTNVSEDKEDTDPNFEFAFGSHYFMYGGRNTHVLALVWSIPSGMRSKGLSVFGIAVRCKNGEIINKSGHEDGMHIKSVGSYKYFHTSVQDNKTDYGTMMYVTCSDPEIELEFYPLYTLDNEEIEGTKRSTTVTVETNNDSGNEDDDSSNEESNNEESNNEDDDNDDINENSYTSLGSTANCYIVSKSGSYKFQTVKGNSSTSVGTVSKAEVLWESFGSSNMAHYTHVGDLIKSVTYKNGYIYLQTADTFRKGNAVIAAKDANGTVLWSWHIWLTDQPQGQVYYNNAGTMMDRNLGATSATPGDSGQGGLYYQWGRKDPFVWAKETCSVYWPYTVEASSRTGTVDYATQYPMTFITCTDLYHGRDWHYASRNNELWMSSKTIYDPCPSGWRVPDGGDDGVWARALGSSDYFDHSYEWSNWGMNFSGIFGSSSSIWYPSANTQNYDGEMKNYGVICYWSASTLDNSEAVCFFFDRDADWVNPSSKSYRADGMLVRCMKE